MARPPHVESTVSLLDSLRAAFTELDLLGVELAASLHIHRTDLRALTHLADADIRGIPATPGWLGAKLGMRSQAVSVLLRRLEGAGLIVRSQDPSDRRSVILTPTEAMRVLGREHFSPLAADLLATIRTLEPSERAASDAFLRAVATTVVRHRDGLRAVQAGS